MKKHQPRQILSLVMIASLLCTMVLFFSCMKASKTVIWRIGVANQTHTEMGNDLSLKDAEGNLIKSFNVPKDWETRTNWKDYHNSVRGKIRYNFTLEKGKYIFEITHASGKDSESVILELDKEQIGTFQTKAKSTDNTLNWTTDSFEMEIVKDATHAIDITEKGNGFILDYVQLLKK